jgi:hypothetical protein
MSLPERICSGHPNTTELAGGIGNRSPKSAPIFVHLWLN